jgi:hypothetical protein
MKPGIILITCRNLPLYKASQFYNDGYHRYCQRCNAEPGSRCYCLSMSHAGFKALRMPRQGKEHEADLSALEGAPLGLVEAIKNKMCLIESPLPIPSDLLTELS